MSVIIKERTESKDKFKNHLKWLVICFGKTVGEHSTEEIALIHKSKILRMSSYCYKIRQIKIEKRLKELKVFKF